ncbi:MAG TPA: TRAP transporter small permease [Succinivibrionaceae bacterium]|nr:TRAP transporter small permease [Succinivibrionaceae bacterium]
MQGLRQLLDKTLMFICVTLFIEMTIVGTYQIVTRYFFNSPSTVSEEIVTYSFTWLSILGAAYVFGKRAHLCMTFFASKFTGKKRVYLDMFSELMVMVVAIPLLIYGGYLMADENFTQETASLGVSVGLMYAVLPISGVIICIYGILNFIDLSKALSSPDVDKYGVVIEE